MAHYSMPRRSLQRHLPPQGPPLYSCNVSTTGPLSSNLVSHSEMEDVHYVAQHEAMRSDAEMVAALKEIEPETQQSEYSLGWVDEYVRNSSCTMKIPIHCRFQALTYGYDTT